MITAHTFRRVTLILGSLVLTLIAVCLPRHGIGAGFEYGPQGFHAVGRGGAFTAKADDPSAFYWNPSKLSLLRGTYLHYSHNFPQENLTFRRFPQENTATGRVFHFCPASEQLGFYPLNASFAITSDFGLEDFTFGLGIVGPSAIGKARFDDPEASGATRYSFLDMDITMMFITASGAWKYRHSGRDWFGFGVSLQYAMIPYLNYSLVVIGPAGPVNQNGPANTPVDLRARLKMKDLAGFTAIVGAFVRPVGNLEFAISSRVLPIRYNPSGDVWVEGVEGRHMIFTGLKPVPVPASLHFTYPATVQLGLRYWFERSGREVGDVEVDFVWENWSQLKSFDIDFHKEKVEIEQLGYVARFKKIVLPRNYKDTYSVRVGGEWNAVQKWLTVRAGGWWESAAQPNDFTNLDFPSWNRFGLAFGLSSEWRGIEIGLAYAHIFQQDRTVCPANAKIYQQVMQADGSVLTYEGRSPPYAVNAGKYSGSLDVLTIGLNIAFEGMLQR